MPDDDNVSQIGLFWNGETGPNERRAEKLKINPKLKGATTTVAWWLLSGDWHPFWPQFVLSVMKLDDQPDMPPANLHFAGATHELFVAALPPRWKGDEHVPYKAKELNEGGLPGFLEPVDVVEQFEATDEEMEQLAELASHACISGLLNPSVDDAREYWREAWLKGAIQTLAHIRGEPHGIA